MLKSKVEKVTSIAIAALLVTGSPASALSGAEAAAFETEIGEARSKMMGQSAAALEHARTARKIARGETSEAKLARLTASYLEAEALLRLNRSGEASPILESTLAEAESSLKGSKLHADLLRSKGGLQARMGQFADALPSFNQAQAIYQDLGENRSQAIVLMNIGSLYSSARQFEEALAHFEQGHEAFPDDPDFALSVHNNSGNALKGLGRYAEAESAFDRALETPRAKGSPLLTARIMTNIAAVQVADGRSGQAKVTALAAMQIADEHAPNWARFIDGVLAQVELADGNPVKAKAHIERAFAGEDLAATAAHFRDFHETAAKIYAELGKKPECDQHESALARLNSKVAQLKS